MESLSKQPPNFAAANGPLIHEIGSGSYDRPIVSGPGAPNGKIPNGKIPQNGKISQAPVEKQKNKVNRSRMTNESFRQAIDKFIPDSPDAYGPAEMREKGVDVGEEFFGHGNSQIPQILQIPHLSQISQNRQISQIPQNRQANFVANDEFGAGSNSVTMRNSKRDKSQSRDRDRRASGGFMKNLFK